MKNANHKLVDECLKFGSSITPYVDGELDPGHAADMEAHVIACSPCAERVTLIRAMRHSLKRTAPRCAPSALCARIRATVEQESARAAAPEDDEAVPKLIRFRYAVGLAAAAAGVVFAVGMSRYLQHGRDNLREERSASFDAASSASSLDALLDNLVAQHADPLPPETTNPDVVQGWDRLVGVPVRRPVFQPLNNANFNGGRLATGYQRAAVLQYTIEGGHRVTWYVFNPRTVSVRPTRLETRTLRQRPIFVGRMRGYSVAATEGKSGIGYALATDLDPEESTQMLAAAVQQ